MGLNKRVCKACRRVQARRFREGAMEWDDTDEREWTEGRVTCYWAQPDWDSRVDEVPSDCPFRTEHLVSTV